MLSGWENFFWMVGSAGAQLIGLLFVVVTLTAGREREQAERGQRLYMNPIIFHYSSVFVLSGAALMHGLPLWAFGTITVALGVLGAVLGIRSWIGTRGEDGMSAHWSDPLFYGLAPVLLYLIMIVGGGALLVEARWSIGVIGAAAVGLILLSVRNAWDLVTWLAPEMDPGKTPPGA